MPVRLIPHSANSSLREFNHCHGPAGKFCSAPGDGTGGGRVSNGERGDSVLYTSPEGTIVPSFGSGPVAGSVGAIPVERRPAVDAAFRQYILSLKGAKQRYAAHVAHHMYNNFDPSEYADPGQFAVGAEDGMNIRVKLARMSFNPPTANKPPTPRVRIPRTDAQRKAAREKRQAKHWSAGMSRYFDHRNS